MRWQLQAAERQFGKLVRQALELGPQVVASHGKAVVVVVSADEYRRLTEVARDFKTFLLEGPDLAVLGVRRTGESTAGAEC